MPAKLKPPHGGQAAIDRAVYFDWTLTDAFHHLTDVCGWRDRQAVGELERAIGAGEIRHSWFALIDGRLESKQEGSADFWRAEVVLRHAYGEVIAGPRRMGWVSTADLVVRVPSEVVKERYKLLKPSDPHLGKSRTERMILTETEQEFPNGREHIPTKDLIKPVTERLKKKGVSVPERSTFERAYNRKK